MLNRTEIEKSRQETEKRKDYFQMSSAEKNIAFDILREFIKLPEFIRKNEDGQQKLLAAACRIMTKAGVPEIKAVTFISNVHGRVSATKGDSLESINELLGIEKKGMLL